MWGPVQPPSENSQRVPHLRRGSQAQKQLNGRISSPVVASDDVADIVFYGVPADFTRMFDRTGLETDRRATVEITYFDISRAKPTVTRLALGLTEESFLQVIDALIEP